MSARKVGDSTAKRAGNRGMGRKKGSVNKTTATVKAVLLEVHEKMGGVKTMHEWAVENPTEFYKLYAKLLPTEITGKDGEPIKVAAQVWQIGDRTVTF